MSLNKFIENGPCPDCAVEVGHLHEPGCDMEQCAECGRQLLSCYCCRPKDHIHPRLPWNGKWRGEAECKEFGWYSVPNPDPNGPRWVSCASGTPDSIPDLNRLFTEATWDPEKKRFVLNS